MYAPITLLKKKAGIDEFYSWKILVLVNLFCRRVTLS
jgi:hypothetical protein